MTRSNARLQKSGREAALLLPGPSDWSGSTPPRHIRHPVDVHLFSRAARAATYVAVLAIMLGGCAPGPSVPETPGLPLTPNPTVSATMPPIGSTIDVARLGYLDNLLARVDADEWELDHGMELTLRTFVGATPLRSVLWRSELASYDLTGVIDTAQTLLAQDPSPLRQAQFGSSLRFLAFDREQLRSMKVDPHGPQPTPARITPPPILGPGETDIEEPTFDPASRSYDTDCELFFRRFPLGPGTRTCLVARTAPAGEATYEVFAPAPSIASFHWSELHHTWIDEALQTAVPLYMQLGEVPEFDVVMAPNLDAPAEAATLFNEGGCVIMLYTHLQLRAEEAFKQVIGRQLAQCFVEATFPKLAKAPYSASGWIHDGLATYLSSIAYPAADLEVASLETLRHIADSSRLNEWSSAAFVWFQYVGNRLGPEGVVELVASLEGSTAEDLDSSLASRPGVDELFHEFALAYTDGTIADSSGGRLATAWDAEDISPPLVETTGDYETVDVPAFGMRRSMLMIPLDRLAQLMGPQSTLGARTSARAYGSGQWGPIPGMFPARCMEDNRLLIVTTNAQATDFHRNVRVSSLDPC